MHKYINPDKIKDFSKKKSFKRIEKDLVEKYKITNINDDWGESLYYITEALRQDYENHWANYEGYIEEGMNARVLMELRKSAILPIDPEWREFYTGHCTLETVQEIKKYRAEKLKVLHPEYKDLDWQYYYLLKYFKRMTDDFMMCFEECYVDGNWMDQTNPQDYKDEMLKAKLMQLKIIEDEDEFTPLRTFPPRNDLNFGFVVGHKPGENCMDNGKAFLDRMAKAVQEQEQKRAQQSKHKNKQNNNSNK